MNSDGDYEDEIDFKSYFMISEAKNKHFLSILGVDKLAISFSRSMCIDISR